MCDDDVHGWLVLVGVVVVVQWDGVSDVIMCVFVELLGVSSARF